MGEVIAFIVAHVVELAGIVLAVLTVAELIVRLTPTKEDDGFVERVGKVIRMILDFLRIPNSRR
jgi:hypothetical protein